MYRGREHTKAKIKIVTHWQKGCESKNKDYKQPEMYFGLKIRRLFKVLPVKTNTIKTWIKSWIHQVKKVTSKLLYQGRNA